MDKDVSRSRPDGGRFLPVLILGVLVLIGGAMMLAKDQARERHEAEGLVRRMASLQGHQTCRLAYLKADGRDILQGRFPDIYAPTLKVQGPPRVVECGLVREGQPAGSLTVLVRCDRVSLDCVDLV